MRRAAIAGSVHMNRDLMGLAGGLSKALFLLCALLAGMVFSAGESRADLDYRCLKECMAGGSSAQFCLSSTGCAYVGKANYLPADMGRQLLSPNRQFDAPTPQSSENLIVPGPSAPKLQQVPAPVGMPAGAPVYSTPGAMITPTIQPLGPSTNYKCRAACLQKGYQLGLCQQQCSY